MIKSKLSFIFLLMDVHTTQRAKVAALIFLDFHLEPCFFHTFFFWEGGVKWPRLLRGKWHLVSHSKLWINKSLLLLQTHQMLLIDSLVLELKILRSGTLKSKVAYLLLHLMITSCKENYLVLNIFYHFSQLLHTLLHLYHFFWRVFSSFSVWTTRILWVNRR